jgi:DNA repair protein RecO (recombination protein O)
VDFFTLEQGRVSAVAKGARGKTKSDRKSLLQTLQKSEFELSGRSNLKNLGKIEGVTPAIRLIGNALYCSFYMNELLCRALPEAEAMEKLFTHYEQSLHAMASLSMSEQNNLRLLEPILREFEFTLLFCLGYLPDFEYDGQYEQAISEGLYYSFDPAIGFVQCHENYPNCIAGKTLQSISLRDFYTNDDPHIRVACKYICRKALAHIIGDKPIKSRELFIT